MSTSLSGHLPVSLQSQGRDFCLNILKRFLKLALKRASKGFFTLSNETCSAELYFLVYFNLRDDNVIQRIIITLQVT